MTSLPVPGPTPRVRLPGPSPSVRAFLSTEAGGAALLLAAAAIALVWANSAWSAGYEHLWSTPLTLSLGSASLDLDLHHWVNDAAMALFFLVVGLEITREVSSGEMRDRRAVAVPALGAVGGLVTPALVYFLFNPSGPAAAGWGIAISTDTAFVLGVLALFGPACPDRLRIFLLTLAIVDDIGAIGVMAVFYSDAVDLTALGLAAILLGVGLVMRWGGVWRIWPYALVGVVMWVVVLQSGVHPTLVGVVLGLTVPTRASAPDPEDVRPYGRALIEQPDAERAHLAGLAVQATISVNERMQRIVHPWTAYLVVPVFGLANAGVVLDSAALEAAASSSVTWGVAVALVVGNAVGITVASVLALRTGWGVLPGRVRYSHLLGAACLAGIGFTISLFITGLAFDDPALQDQAKIGILAGSLVAAVLGSLVLRVLGNRFPLCSPGSHQGLPALPPRPWREPATR